MDIAHLTTFLSPFLPFLINPCETASEEAGGRFEAADWNKAKAVWSKLYLEVERHPDVKVAVTQVASKPESQSRRAVLQEELETLLNEQPTLAEAIAQILKADPPNAPTTQITQTVTGNRNQVIAQVTGGQIFGNVSGNVVIGNAAEANSASTSESSSAKTAVKTILVLAANPKGTSPLRLGEEVRQIQAGLERSQHRDRFRLEQRWAVTTKDIRRALLDCQPQIVHFSGHGVGVETHDGQPVDARKFSPVSTTAVEPEGLLFEDETGQPKLVSAAAIANLFALFADQVECVVLNACYSVVQADAIAEEIPYVVGMKRAIGDRAAIEFAIAFYDALLAGRDVEFAYKLGCNAIQMEGTPEHSTPELKQKLK